MDDLVLAYLDEARHAAARYYRSWLPCDKEDLFQEAVLGLMEASAKFQPGSRAFGAYAYQMCCWRVLDYLTGLRRQGGIGVGASWTAQSREATPYQAAANKDSLRYVLTNLPTQEVVLLRWSLRRGSGALDQAAEILGTSSRAIKIRLTKTRHHTQRILEGEGDGRQRCASQHSVR